MRRNSPLRQEIERLAARQFGHVTRGQVLGLGLTSDWIHSQMRLGTLIRVHAGGYALGAALSHASAAALWDVGEWPPVPEVVAPVQRRHPGIASHRSCTLVPRELRTHQGIRATSPVRTVLDLQPRITDARLTRMINDLRVAGRLRTSAFAELCARSRRIDRLLGNDLQQRPSRSVLENRFRAFVTRHHLPMPQINAILPQSGREVDALYPRARLIVELDSWRHHHSRASFERDRAKDARALADAYQTLRITDRRLAHGGTEEAATIRRILALTQ